MTPSGGAPSVAGEFELPAVPPLRAVTPVRDGEVPLVELLDRLLETGVSLSGDLVISIADVDLVWLGLRAVLQGIDEGRAGMPLPGVRRAGTRRTGSGRPLCAPAISTRRSGPGSAADREGSPRGSAKRSVPAAAKPRGGASRLGIDPDHVERGLVQLVLTIVDLVRELLERQALRRVDTDALSDTQVEQLGRALLRLEQRMEELKAHFGLSDEDLRLRLGAVSDLE